MKKGSMVYICHYQQFDYAELVFEQIELFTSEKKALERGQDLFRRQGHKDEELKWKTDINGSNITRFKCKNNHKMCILVIPQTVS